MRLRSLITLLPFAPLAFLVLAPGIAAADTPPTYPILPNQYFQGVVNGQTAGATVYTACPGPTTGYGHPISGQTLSVSRVSDPITTDVGFTGSLGNSIEATPVLNLIANAPVKFTEYFRSSALPTTWTVPCDGDGRIAFSPKPGSPTALTDYVTVRFVNIATAP